VSPKPKSKCCRSTPQCRRCPLRAAPGEPCGGGEHLPRLFAEVLGPNRRALPPSVSEALASLALARTRATAPAEAG
jgi:hypothetical protein